MNTPLHPGSAFTATHFTATHLPIHPPARLPIHHPHSFPYLTFWYAADT
ncbi:MAG: hypothetical protein VKK04_12120 [Synechococcales bacterium]|nr:hypothetical protein [Synechococcales bacterium]